MISELANQVEAEWEKQISMRRVHQTESRIGYGLTFKRQTTSRVSPTP